MTFHTMLWIRSKPTNFNENYIFISYPIKSFKKCCPSKSVILLMSQCATPYSLGDLIIENIYITDCKQAKCMIAMRQQCNSLSLALGLTMDDKLNWKKHTEELCQKLTKRINTLKKNKEVYPRRSTNEPLLCLHPFKDPIWMQTLPLL